MKEMSNLMTKEEMIGFLVKTLFDGNNVLRIESGFKPLELPKDKDTPLSWTQKPLLKSIHFHAQTLYAAIEPYITD